MYHETEDAPAPSPLHSFKTHVSNGKIRVTANPEFTLKDNTSRPPKLSTAGFDAVGKGTVIIGGGSGAFQAVESLREVNLQGKAILTRSHRSHRLLFASTVTSSRSLLYQKSLTHQSTGMIDLYQSFSSSCPDVYVSSRTKLSKAIITDASKLQWKTPADLKIKYGVNLRAGVAVTSVELQDRRVILDDGKDTIIYDKLIIAPGATPRKLPISGVDLENVYTFRGVEDAKKVDSGMHLFIEKW